MRINSAAIAADAEGVGQGAVFAYQGALESQLAESITKISNEFNPDNVFLSILRLLRKAVRKSSSILSKIHKREMSEKTRNEIYSKTQC